MKKLLCAVACAALLVTALATVLADQGFQANNNRLRAVPQPSMGGTITTVTNTSAGKLASFVVKGGLGDNAKTVTVKVGVKTRYILLTSQPGQKPVWGTTENLTDASAVQVGRSADCFFATSDTAMAGAATSVYLRIPHTGNTQHAQ